MKSRTYASIDIGSNAIRLLISTANFDGERLFFKKNALSLRNVYSILPSKNLT